MSFLIGPYLGPFISSFCIEKIGWRPDFGILCGFYGWSVLMIVFLGDETLYDRGNVQKPASKGLMRRILLMTGVEGARVSGRPSIWTVLKHQFSILIRPYLYFPS